MQVGTLLRKQMVADSGKGEAAEMAALTIRCWAGAGDESRTRDPGCPEGSTLLGKHWVDARSVSNS